MKIVIDIFNNLVSSASSEELQAVKDIASVEMTKHENSVLMDSKLFARVSHIYSQLPSSDKPCIRRPSAGPKGAWVGGATWLCKGQDVSILDAIDKRLVERYYDQFVRAGGSVI